ncbi:MAG TPA: mycothiol synthase, partial [Pseudonocardiaceae bacterium]
RPAEAPLPDPPVLPDGVRLRAFRPGADEAALLAVNNRAFATHPEQGRWTERDVLLREREPWFDADGLLLAVDSDDRVVGFHWTKVHDPVRGPGEVYVLGVDPDRHGGGLGRALTAAGLRYLRERRGTGEVILYVEADNEPALRVYRALGFTTRDTDVRYAR